MTHGLCVQVSKWSRFVSAWQLSNRENSSRHFSVRPLLQKENFAASCLVTIVSVFLWTHHVTVPCRLRCLGSRHPNPQTGYSTLTLAHCCVIYTQPLVTGNSCKSDHPSKCAALQLQIVLKLYCWSFFFVTCSCLWDELEFVCVNFNLCIHLCCG